MPDMLHISREYSWRSQVFMEMQKFRNLTHKRVFFQKMWILGCADMAKFGGVTLKMSFQENWCHGYEFHLFKWRSKAYDTPSARIFVSKSVILTDLSQNPNFRYVGKYGSFWKSKFPPNQSIWVRMGIPVSLESASGLPTKPSYYNLKMSFSKEIIYFVDIYVRTYFVTFTQRIF